MKRIAIAIAALGLIASACSSDADVASSNLSKAAEEFEIERRVVFMNGITDSYPLVIEGRCSIEVGASTGVANAIEVTCKTGPDEYKKHFLGLSDNMTYFVEQLVSADVSTYHYRVFFRPEQILPDIDTQTSGSG